MVNSKKYVPTSLNTSLFNQFCTQLMSPIRNTGKYTCECMYPNHVCINQGTTTLIKRMKFLPKRIIARQYNLLNLLIATPATSIRVLIYVFQQIYKVLIYVCQQIISGWVNFILLNRPISGYSHLQITAILAGCQDIIYNVKAVTWSLFPIWIY